MTESLNIASEPSQGYFVDYRDGAQGDDTVDHTFCGPQFLPGAICPNCHKPLLRFLALDTRDSRLNLQDCLFVSLPLLFCWTCNIAQQEFYYRCAGDEVKLLQFGKAGIETDFPYENYPESFPAAKATLRAITSDEQSIMSAVNATENTFDLHKKWPDLTRVRHQIGGEPYFVQYCRNIECPQCHGLMPFFASVADDCLDDRGLVGEDFVQVLYHICRSCFVVGAYQDAD